MGEKSWVIDLIVIQFRENYSHDAKGHVIIINYSTCMSRHEILRVKGQRLSPLFTCF